MPAPRRSGSAAESPARTASKLNAQTGQKTDPSIPSRALAALAAGYLRFVARTSRVEFTPTDAIAQIEAAQPVIYAFWHGQFLLIPTVRPKRVPTGVMVARHDDAETLSNVLARFDLSLIRGAGAGMRKRDRGGAAALRTALTALKSGTSVAMTADVPPGPARRVGDGIIALARLSHCPIVPAAVASSRFRVLNTWSRMTINLPFSTIRVRIGAPLHVPRNETADTYDMLRGDLERTLDHLTATAYPQDASSAPLSGRATPPGLAAKLYAVITRCAESAAATLLARRVARGKEDKSRLNERLGKPIVPRPDGHLVWFHAASVGELNAIRTLLKTVKATVPDTHILLTTGTVTSANTAASQLSEVALHQYVPLDSPRMVSRFLDHWQPAAAFFVESELWPNLIFETSRRKIPMALLNAHVSDKSIKAWRKPWSRRTGAALFTAFDLILAQSPAVMMRFMRLGAHRIVMAGNLKSDGDVPQIDAEAREDIRRLVAERTVVVAASTHDGEETIFADAHVAAANEFSNLLTIIAPRHPERGPQIADQLRAAGHDVAIRSKGETITAKTGIYLADTLGELPLWFDVSQLAIMGGSLIPHGGHNPLEPMRQNIPVLTGPHVHNFREIYDTLDEAAAIIRLEATDANALATALLSVLDDPATRETMITNSAMALRQLSGALTLSIDHIRPWLSPSPSPNPAKADDDAG
ncbi:MAG: glycosyltransferase N-terminal domain-containing protein [Pseudomonadota bacterium]